MKNALAFAKPLSWASLLLIVVPPVLRFSGNLGEPLMNQLLMAGTLIWFASASLWMRGE